MPVYTEVGLVDILANILPAVAADSPQSLEEALTKLHELQNEGVTDVVAATPFAAASTAQFLEANALILRVRALERIAQQARIAIRLYAAHVLRLDSDIEQALIHNVAATINDSAYVLLDLTPVRRPLIQMQRMPMRLAALIQRLRILGFVPVLIHIERYPPVQRNPNVLLPLISAGALLQVTIASLDGAYGEQTRQTATTLLERDLAHVLASDTPTASVRSLRRGLHIAEHVVGRQRLLELVRDVPEAMIHSAPVEATAPIISANDDGFRRAQ